MSDTHGVMMNEIRYAERLCLRTARLYRRAQTIGVFVTIVSGSAAMSALSSGAPKWLSIAGFIALTLFGAAMIAIRPAEKATANEADAKRYGQLRTAANTMDDVTLRAAIDKAREGDGPEIEPLRDVAYNDVVVEVGRPDVAIPLTPKQKVLAALA
ncbi:MAG TPA: hypothetical protein VNU71_22155 [Burkholderiaceae bacterium]|nr:hypothetical protein [Burkholderiaceae bacterium]